MYIYYVIVFFAFLLFYSIFTKKWAISTYLIAIYILSLIVSLFISEFFPLYSDSQKGAIIFTSGISLFILPYIKKEPILVGIDNQISLKKIISTVELISILLVFLEICIIPTILGNTHVEFSDLREGESAQQSNFIISFFMKIMDMVCPLSYSLLTIFFYLYTFVSCRKKLLVMVFLASLSAPIYGITAGGRTQMIYWLLSLVFNIVLFYKYLEPHKAKYLSRILAVFVGLILLYISIATISRFSDTSYGAENSLLIYMGQSYLQFNHFIEEFPSSGSITLRRIFPFIYSLIYGNESIDVYRDLITARTGMDIGIFYTLLGDLFVDVGIVGMYIYAIVYNIVARHSLRGNKMDISSLLLLNLLFLIPLQGVFYYSFWKKQVTFCAFLVILFSRYIKSSPKANIFPKDVNNELK